MALDATRERAVPDMAVQLTTRHTPRSLACTCIPSFEDRPEGLLYLALPGGLSEACTLATPGSDFYSMQWRFRSNFIENEHLFEALNTGAIEYYNPFKINT